MRKILLSFACLLALLVVAVVLFAWRPWSDYSPLAMYTLFSPSHRVENFRHMDRIFPYRSIPASRQPYTYPRDEKPLHVRYRFDGTQRTLDGFLKRVTATGLLVIKNGTIVHEAYYRGADADSRFTSWSVAKSFVATLVGMALAEGRIQSLDDPISDYVPALQHSGYNGVPIKHVLQMASGVKFDETYGAQFSDVQKFFWKVFVFGRHPDSVMTDYGSARPSGQVFHYVSINTQALAMLLRAVYDKPLPKLVDNKLWQPLGMGANAYWNVDRQGKDATAIAFCCLNARLRDYAKLGSLYLHHGRFNGKRLLPEQWVLDATTPGAAFLQPGATAHHYGGRGYQYQWWVPPQPQREYFASGVWGQYIYVSEPDNLVIARTSVDPDFTAHMPETMVVFRAIRDALR